MKNVYYIMFILFLSLKSFAQGGVDVVFWLDNSNSIDNDEFADMVNSVESLGFEILNCNALNRAAVVHYGMANPGPNIFYPKIYIESDFTNNTTLLNSFVRRTTNVGGGDHAHEALALIGKAMDNVNDTYIVSPQKTLNHISTNALVIVLFTDATRSTGDSYLVNRFSSGTGTDAAFTNYTDFKNSRDAVFMVNHVPTSTSIRNACAAIASVGGSYTGTVESYPSDPDGSGVTGRYFVEGDFALTISQIEVLTEYTCTLATTECLANLILDATDNVSTGQDNQQAYTGINASNIISNIAVGVYHAGDNVVLTSGFHSANGSRFRGYIEGCTGEFEGRPGANDQGKTNQELQEQSLKEVKLFSLSPNPASEIVSITATENMQSIVVTSFEGKTIFSKELKEGTHNYELYVGNYLKGFYSITVVTRDGKLQTQKLIKD